MRKQSLFFAVIFALLFAATGHAMVELEVVAPTTFVREKGAPTTETITFSALGGQAILKLTKGSFENSSVRKVGSAIINMNGQRIFGSSDFNQNVDYLEREVSLLEGQNTLEALLKGKPGGELTVKIIQNVVEITPEMVRVRTANYLRAGNTEGALQGFEANEKSQIIPTLDATQRNQLAHWIENAELVSQKDSFRWYRYIWTDEKFSNFAMARDNQGQWIITSW